MKKILLVVSLILANQVFASVEDVANKSFELRKNAYNMAPKDVESSCLSIHDSLQDELKGKSADERRAIKAKFRDLINQKFDALSPAEKNNFSYGVCRQFNSRGGYGMNRGNCQMMNNGCRMNNYGNCGGMMNGCGNYMNNYGGGYYHHNRHNGWHW